mmetsp:Transcript_83878/g.264795  ORF Transcript_83878/g.264795 Transcript_83878/m.264795 type:complete len:215 (-) Transcript_83878:1335-1979(-)
MTNSSSSELATLVSRILLAMVLTFSGQILFRRDCTFRLNSCSLVSGAPCLLKAVAEGGGSASTLPPAELPLAPPPPPPRPPSRSRSRSRRPLPPPLVGIREPNSRRSGASRSPAAAPRPSPLAEASCTAPCFQALSSSFARRLTSDSGTDAPMARNKSNVDLSWNPSGCTSSACAALAAGGSATSATAGGSASSASSASSTSLAASGKGPSSSP